MARPKGNGSGLRSCWKSEGKAKWEGGMRLLLMEGKTRKIQVSGSIRVGCGREKLPPGQLLGEILLDVRREPNNVGLFLLFSLEMVLS